MEQPSNKAKQELVDVATDAKSEVEVRGKKWKVGYMYNGTMLKITEIVSDENGDEKQVSCKCAAAMRLNGYWSIRLFYWVLWRWMYFISCYTENELSQFIAECKKKAPAGDYLMNTILLTEMQKTTMQMRREEVLRIRQELISGQHGHSEKSTNI